MIQFAADLRCLRAEAGGPTYRELSARAHYSAAALSEAAGGRKLPSLAVTLAYVQACDGDVPTWEARWRETAACFVNLNGNGAAEDTELPAPYVGLAPLRVEDADRFFGRDRLVVQVSERLHQRRFVGVFGPSGSGKSSLLHAGLVPAVAAEPGGRWSVITFTPGADPLEECAVQMTALTGASAVSVRSELADSPDNLRLLIRQAMAGRPAQQELLLVVDQFEETFTLCTDKAQRAWFVAALVAAATAPESRTRVVLGVRADFYGHCAQHPELVEALHDAQVLVGPMTADELREAITEPAVRAGYRVETALVSRLVADATGQPAALPLVAHALLETWKRRHGTTLTLAAYETVGGIRHAVARTAEATYTGLDRVQQRLARQVFLRLTALGDGTEDTGRRVDRSELDDHPDTEAVLHILAAARLVTLDRGSVHFAHESLIKHWPRLQRWLNDNREGLHVHRQLTEATHIWETLHRDPGALYRGTRLALAHDWTKSGPSPALSSHEKAFLSASLAAQASERTAELRRARHLRQLIVTLASLLVVTTATTIFGVDAQRTALEQRKLALVHATIRQADALRASDSDQAFRLSLATYRIAPSELTQDNLLSSAAVPHSGHAIAVSTDGDTLATVWSGPMVELFDLTSHHRPERITMLKGDESTARVTNAQFSPDGHLLAIATSDVDTTGTTIHLVETADRRNPKFLSTRSTGYSRTMMFDADGRTLITSGGVTSLWDLSDPTEPILASTVDGQLSESTRTNDTHTIALIDGPDVRLIDIRDPYHPKELTTLTGHSGKVNTAVFDSKDNNILATASDDSTIKLWDVTDPAHPSVLTTLSDHSSAVIEAAFSPYSATLATISSDGTVRLWDLIHLDQPRQLTVLTEHGDATSVVFGPNGWLVTSSGHTIRLWELNGAKLSATLSGESTITVLVLSPNNHTLITTGTDRIVRFWKTSVAHLIARACAADPVPDLTAKQWQQYFPGMPYQRSCS